MSTSSQLLMHCSRDHYHSMSPDTLDVFAVGVKSGFFGNNPPFTVQPFTEATLQGNITDYVTKRGLYKTGGLAQRTRAVLLAGLDSIADEVDKVAAGNGDIITLSGNVATDGTRTASVKPLQPVATLERGGTRELIARCETVQGAKHYGCILVENQPLPAYVVLSESGKLIFDFSSQPPTVPSMIVDLSDQREKHFTNLTHDATYYLYMYAVNSAGVSPLSDVVSMVCW
jgi:hypothetical protein